MNEEVTGYDALNFDGLERRGNYRFIAYREDMLHALDKKDAAATIYQIVYRWQVEYKREEVLKKIDERKKSGQKPYTQEEVEDMMFVYMSYNDFVHESGGAIGYNTVIRTLDYLVDKKKALKQRPNHDPKYPDFEYSVNKEVVRELLKALPPDPAFAPKIPKKKNSSTQMGTPENDDDQSTQMGIGSTQTGIPSTQMGTEVYPNGGTSQELTSNTQELTREDTISHVSIDNATLTQLQNENASLKAELEKWMQIADASKGSASPTPAGRNTVLEANHPADADNIVPDHTPIPKPVVSPTMPRTDVERVNVPPTPTEPSETPLQPQETPSSTQDDVDTSNQATEQQQQANGVDPIANGATKTRGRGGKGKGKEKPVIDEVTQKRIDHVYEYFDGLRREVSGKPDARYRRTKTDTESIVEWLASNPTEEILHEVYLELWNTPDDKRTNFSWKNNMWIHSVLKQYEIREMAILDKRRKQAARNVSFTIPGVKSTFVPPPEEEDEMPFVRPSELYSRKRG